MRVNSYTAKRGSKTVSVTAHTKKDRRFRSVTSSCVDRVSEGENGGMSITIRGKEYPYPYLPSDKVGGLINASSSGRYYNKNIRGRYF